VGFAADGVYVALSTGEGFAQPVKWMDGYGTTAGWANQDAYPRQLIDVDGDGLLDVLGFGGGNVMVALNKRDKFENAPIYSAFTSFTQAGGWTSNDIYPKQATDINGDGRADIIGFHAGGVYVSLNTAAGFSPAVMWVAGYGYSVLSNNNCTSPYTYKANWISQAVTPRILADLNGDGLPDIVGFNIQASYKNPTNAKACTPKVEPLGVRSDIYVSYNTGGGYSAPVRVGQEFPYQNIGSADAVNYMYSMAAYPKIVGDTNFDGRADILRVNTAGCIQAFSFKVAGLDISECVAGAFPATGNGNLQVVDNYKNGIYGLLGFSTDGVRVATSAAKSPNKVLSFKTDLAESKLTYSTMAEVTAYQKGSGSTFPLIEVQVPNSVVTAISNPDGLGGVRQQFYRYGGLRSHFDYGSLGFEWMETMDPATGGLAHVEYKQEFPYTGAASRNQSQRCTGTGQIPWTGCEVLSQEVTEWSSAVVGDAADKKIYMPFIQRTQENNWARTSP
jgi:hypothetical protein